MKKVSILISISIITFISCPVTPEDDILIPADLVSDHCNVLINNGADILDEVLNSYTYLPELAIFPVVASFTDYALFPHNWEDLDTSFDDRMAAVYWHDDNLLETYKLLVEEDQEEVPTEATAGTDKSVTAVTAIIGLAISAYKAFKSSQQANERNQILKMNGEILREIEAGIKTQHLEVMEALGGIRNDIGAVYGQIHTANRHLINIQLYLKLMKEDIQNQLDKITTRLTTYLRRIERDIAGFRTEMREHLTQINTKIDTVIDRIDDLKGDVNALQSDVDWLTLNILSADLNDNMNAINAFLADYGNATDLAQAQNLAESYVDRHTEIVLNFIDAALTMQAYAQDPTRGDKYVDWVSQESNSVATKLRYTLEIDDVDGDTFNLDYTNPKQGLAVSYGNLEYLYKIFMTRFIIHHILYTGYELEQSNSNLAATYVHLLETKGIKDSFESTLKDMDDTYQAYVAMIDGEFSFHGPDVTNVTLEKYGDGGWSEIGNLDTMTTDEMIEEVTTAYIYTFIDYIGPYAAELLSMEVDLRAYIVD